MLPTPPRATLFPYTTLFRSPTTLAEHYIIADQCVKAGMKLVSLAPRFIGEFEKGVDYKGDLKALEKSLGDHAAIAQQLDRKSTRLNSSHLGISYAVFCLKKK